MPKTTDLSVHTNEDLARFARSLNNRPRKTLGYMKPSERLAQLLALTAWTRLVKVAKDLQANLIGDDGERHKTEGITGPR
jgi:hypothetical protein